MEWEVLITFKEEVLGTINPTMFLVEAILVASLVETTVKKIYECQNVAKIINKTEIKRIAKQKSTNQTLRQTPAKFNQTITHSLVASKETIFYLRMTTFMQKSSLAQAAVKILRNL